MIAVLAGISVTQRSGQPLVDRSEDDGSEVASSSDRSSANSIINAQDPSLESESESALTFFHGHAVRRALLDLVAQTHPKCAVKTDVPKPECEVSSLEPVVARTVHAFTNSHTIFKNALGKVNISATGRKHVLSGASHITDRRLHALARNVTNAMNCSGGGDGISDQERVEILQREEQWCDMEDLRGKLFPAIPSLGKDTRQAQQFRRVAIRNACHSIQFSRAPAPDMSEHFKMDYPTTGQAEPWEPFNDWTLQGGRRLPGSSLDIAPFAPGNPPLPQKAPTNGKPPPDDLAGDICAALVLPFSHIVMASLHHDGKLTLPYWTKLTMTIEGFFGAIAVEDAATAGITYLVDMIYIWQPRGYHYDTPDKYPAGFLKNQ
jgi:hypothetical protein